MDHHSPLTHCHQKTSFSLCFCPITVMQRGGYNNIMHVRVRVDLP